MSVVRITAGAEPVAVRCLMTRPATAGPALVVGWYGRVRAHPRGRISQAWFTRVPLPLVVCRCPADRAPGGVPCGPRPGTACGTTAPLRLCLCAGERPASARTRALRRDAPYGLRSPVSNVCGILPSRFRARTCRSWPKPLISLRCVFPYLSSGNDPALRRPRRLSDTLAVGVGPARGCAQPQNGDRAAAHRPVAIGQICQFQLEIAHSWVGRIGLERDRPWLFCPHCQPYASNVATVSHSSAMSLFLSFVAPGSHVSLSRCERSTPTFSAAPLLPSPSGEQRNGTRSHVFLTQNPRPNPIEVVATDA